MRKKVILSEALFQVNVNEASEWVKVALPHTWNALDGQDGGSDYERGERRYKIDLPAPSEGYKRYERRGQKLV